MKKASRNIIVFFIVAGLGMIIAGASLASYLVSAPPPVYLASGHPEWPPIMWRNGGKIIGAGANLATRIFLTLGVKIDTKYVGLWDTVQSKAKSGEVDVLVGAYKTAERETYLDYSVPYTVDPIVLYVKQGKNLKFTKWEDLIGKKGVATIGDSYGQAFDDFIAAKLKITRVNTVNEAFQQIIGGQADYFVYALYAGEKAVAENKLEGKVKNLPKTVAEENFYMAISKKSPLARYLPEVNKLIKQYKQDGTIEAILKNSTDDYMNEIKAKLK